jgi:hypothetical protein
MSGFKDKLIHKLKATSIHLGISLLIFIGILYLILYDWYPEPFFTAQGGWQGIRLMALVDLVLGPTLTFIVYNHLKSRLEIVLDLSVIAIVQALALAWGGNMVYSQRPVALVFWTEAFYTVTSEDFLVQGIEDPDLSKFSTHTPPLIYSRSLVSEDELREFKQLTNQSIPVYAHISLYESIDEHLESIFYNQVDIREVMENNAEMKVQIEKIVDKDVDTYRYVALKAKYQNMILIMKEDGTLIGEIKAPYHD